MLSKWQVWDFFSAHPGALKEFTGLSSFRFFDPLIVRIFKEKLQDNKNLPSGFTSISGSTLTKEWIENNLISLSLFGNSDSYYIFQAEEIPKDSFEYILGDSLLLDDRFLTLSFNKDCPLWRKLSTKKYNSSDIQGPKFWEFNILLDYLIDYYEIRLSYEAKNYILKFIDHSVVSFSNALNIIKLNYGDQKEISIQNIQSVIKPNKFDQFALAAEFAMKKYSLFYENVLKIGDDFNSLRSLFMFLQSHLIKIADTSYSSSKNRLTKYDKEVMSCSKLWKSEDLQEAIQLFGELEVMAKQKSQQLLFTLRRECLKSYH
ncbi:MAG: hypothetical protein ACI9QD_001264 [Thermoproteota archaeon]|jgi:hypothetical protein